MARIRRIEPGTQNIRVHETEVDCAHQVVTDDDGTVYLHLSTFGSDERKSGHKSSQTIQIDKQIAARLRDLINETFFSG